MVTAGSFGQEVPHHPGYGIGHAVGQMDPCIAEANPGREGLDLLFPQKAKRLRGLVGYVEIPGKVAAGEAVTAHVPEQWIYERI